MCTAVTYKTKDTYFGRNLDLEYSYKETVTITPRNYVFNFRKMGKINKHYAMIGMAYVMDNYPLYYDAINEKGLGMAGLNFPTNAYYFEEKKDKKNIAPFEFIPYVLSNCQNIKEVRELLKDLNLVNINYSDNLKVSPLHWIIADCNEALTVESTIEGLKVYDNKVGVLTNNPTFDKHMWNLNNYMSLSPLPPQNNFSNKLTFDTYSRGMGGLGLPGDLSSASRFVKATFTKMNSVSKDDENSSISQFFHILESVYQQRGCCIMGKDEYEITIYSSCCNLNKGIYYYKTYDNSMISKVDMHKEDLDSDKIVSYDLIKEEQIYSQN